MKRRLFLLPPLLLLVLLTWVFWDMPDPRAIADRQVEPGVRIVDRHGRLLYETIDQNSGRHVRLTSGQIPDVVRQAAIATEDRNFYTHPGVDAVGIARALWINVRGGEVLAGGSTITQQLARTMVLDDEERFERTVRRKLRESWLAWRLSRLYTKDEILTLYLNQTYYGGLAYGIEAAAQTFFGRSTSELTTAQAALLAGLPQAPATYNPLLDPEAAKNRQAVVLGLMHTVGWLDSAEYEQALREPLTYAADPYPIKAPHFVQMVQAELDHLVPPADRHALGGLVVRTTLDLDWQQTAENIVAEQISRLDDPPDGSASRRVNSGALVAINPHNGEVLTLVGSPDFFSVRISGSINMALAPRQPGSTLKPLIYAAAMDPTRPRPFTAATMLLDVETVFSTKKGETYIPVNFSRREHGPVLVRQALGSSLNIPAVQTLDYIGVPAGLALMKDLGVNVAETPEDIDLSIALGGGAVSLYDLTRAYAALANGGERLELQIIQEVTTAAGGTVYTAPEPVRTRVIDPRLAWLISDILADNHARQSAFGTSSVLNIGRPAAVKTGTTNDFRDNWTVGYTPDLVVGVWVGNADNSPMNGITGLSGAGPIWHRFIRAAVADQAERPFGRPVGLVEREVCALSGLLPTAACSQRRREWFIEGTEPREDDSMFKRIPIDKVTGLPATAVTPAGQVEWQIALDLPAAAHAWARREGLLLYEEVLFVGEEVLGTDQLSLLAWQSPTPHVTYVLSTELPADAQRLAFEISSRLPLDRVVFWLNGEIVGAVTERPYRMTWMLAAGDYALTAAVFTSQGEEIILEGPVFAVRGGE